eukprot:9500923-Pyramimonas_sp.AAC.1
MEDIFACMVEPKSPIKSKPNWASEHHSADEAFPPLLQDGDDVTQTNLFAADTRSQKVQPSKVRVVPPKILRDPSWTPPGPLLDPSWTPSGGGHLSLPGSLDFDVVSIWRVGRNVFIPCVLYTYHLAPLSQLVEKEMMGRLLLPGVARNLMPAKGGMTEETIGRQKTSMAAFCQNGVSVSQLQRFHLFKVRPA